MKKVIFMCLLSVSMCLSVPTQQQAEDLQKPAPVNNSTPTNPTQASAVPQAANGPTQGTPQAGNETANSAVVNATTAKNATQATPLNTPTAQGSTNATEEKAPTPKAGVTEHNATEAAPVTTAVPTKMPTVAPEEKGKNKTVSPTPSTPVVNTTPANPTLQSRAFDGPSFIGGIILTLGLLAVGFMGFKYYKKQHAENYHTL